MTLYGNAYTAFPYPLGWAMLIPSGTVLCGFNQLLTNPVCKSSIVKQIYNQSKIFPHKEGCINIGKIPIKSSEPD